MKLENNTYLKCYLLGNCGYACKKYLLSSAQQRYNSAHKTGRNVVKEVLEYYRKDCLVWQQFCACELSTGFYCMVLYNTTILLNKAKHEEISKISKHLGSVWINQMNFFNKWVLGRNKSNFYCVFHLVYNFNFSETDSIWYTRPQKYLSK